MLSLQLAKLGIQERIVRSVGEPTINDSSTSISIDGDSDSDSEVTNPASPVRVMAQPRTSRPNDNNDDDDEPCNESPESRTSTHVGKVVKRANRQVYLNNCDEPIDLNEISAEFVPMIGDWVKLDCCPGPANGYSVAIGCDRLRVLSIKPNRTYCVKGQISTYVETDRCGTINRTIAFNGMVCRPGYLPRKDDVVCAMAVESDQHLHGLDLRWRALEIFPVKDLKFSQENAMLCGLGEARAKELVRDKENIEVTNDIRVSVEHEATTTVLVTIRNNGNISQEIVRCTICSSKNGSMLKLLSPACKYVSTLKSEAKIEYVFECEGKWVGTHKEMVVFVFRNAYRRGARPEFRIGRVFEIKVRGKGDEDDNENDIDNNGGKKLRSIIPKVYEDGMYLRGVRPYNKPKFTAPSQVHYHVPNSLWTTMDTLAQETATVGQKTRALLQEIACFKESLSFDNYTSRFHHLLYLEQIERIVAMARFDMDGVVMRKSGDFLTIHVPGIAEKRPSLITGDRIVVNYPWDKNSKDYEGFIHKIKGLDLYVRFHAAFHASYKGEVCHVSFKASNTTLQRGHTAIEAVFKGLGEEFLFPMLIEEKEPQYDFVEANDGNGGHELTMTSERIETLAHKRKFRWINGKLNQYQREAVKNILKGVARPLPYVVFGPPGTGKTITVVEAILQIYFTMPESRILVATPSNSSANLIAERLLDARKLKPGDMVRLVANHYMENNMVPHKLLPYSKTADLAEEGTRVKAQTQDSVENLCHHRIIVATCMTSGVFYRMGVKPGHFTHVVVDEAGQASEPEIMIPLSMMQKDTTQVVLAGDPQQLGPVIQSRVASSLGLGDSFLVRLLKRVPYQRDAEGFGDIAYDPRLITKLRINYRSLPDLLCLPNQLFYDSELIPSIDPESSEEAQLLQSLYDGGLSERLPRRIGGPPAIIFHGVNGQNVPDPESPSWFNPDEASHVLIHLTMLYGNGLKPADIGIITPYSKQVHHLRSMLRECIGDDLPKIGSVEEFQGQERKVILLSTVRTWSERQQNDAMHSLGFVAARERLNVAITRARVCLIIIGDPQLLQQDIYWRNVIDHCRIRNSVIDPK